MSIRSTALAALALLSLPALVPSAQAYSTWNGKWSASPTLLINSASAVWFAAENGSITTAQDWVYKNSSKFGIYTAADDDNVTSINNGENELTYTYSFTGTCGATAGGGCTFATYDTTTGLRSETDVFMDGNLTWENALKASDTWSYNGAYRPAVTTLLHEFGHAMGLGHENRYYNMMGDDWQVMTVNGNAYTSALGEDAATGLRSLYGSATGYEDLAVSHWRYSAASGEYSTHARNRITDSAGTELPVSWNGLIPTYTVTKGAIGKVEITLENNGAASQTTYVRTYLSSDSTITTADTTLASYIQIFTPDTPYTAYYQVTWPSTLTSGTTWYVGACVDANSTLTEIREDNNCAYIAALKVK
jgi:hypothetical protein